MNHSASRLLLAILFTAGLLAGCGAPEGGADQLPTYDVTARVTVDGKPFGGAGLTMAPTDASHPNSGASLAEDGTGKFSTYGPDGGIPAGEYTAGMMYDTANFKPVPQVVPLKITITEEMDGGEIKVDFKSTGKTQKSPLPPPGQ